MSREKQIEAIANILWHIPNNYFLNSYNDCERIAECIYDDGGYRKQSEGEWVRESFRAKNGEILHHTPTCSVCGMANSFTTNYCPNCGAKMKGGAE